MARRVLLEDLIDAREVARILGLSHRNTVSLYLRRYPEMPRPVLDLGAGRPSLWLRPEVERWHVRQIARGRTRPSRRVTH
jgi:glutathione-regulated potassium-efflux system ancillary protein KefG